jgi:predicted RNase H-like nuclease
VNRSRDAVGVDACPGGWLAATPKGGKPVLEVFRTLTDLLDRYSQAVTIYIDMPIGLPYTSGGRRACDILGRDALGPARSSIFDPPCRQALDAQTHAQANDINRKILGRGLSIQSFNIMHRIRELDAVLHSGQDLRGRIYETHPELNFLRMHQASVDSNTRPAKLPSKKTAEGLAVRRELLRDEFGDVGPTVDQALQQYPRRVVKPDDMMDALACLAVAHRDHDQRERLPGEPEMDKLGLPMCITTLKSAS